LRIFSRSEDHEESLGANIQACGDTTNGKSLNRPAECVNEQIELLAVFKITYVLVKLRKPYRYIRYSKRR
jgi:hypothetical protein